jgi:hypothetical protein
VRPPGAAVGRCREGAQAWGGSACCGGREQAGGAGAVACGGGAAGRLPHGGCGCLGGAPRLKGMPHTELETSPRLRRPCASRKGCSPAEVGAGQPAQDEKEPARLEQRRRAAKAFGQGHALVQASDICTPRAASQRCRPGSPQPRPAHHPSLLHSPPSAYTAALTARRHKLVRALLHLLRWVLGPAGRMRAALCIVPSIRPPPQPPPHQPTPQMAAVIVTHFW